MNYARTSARLATPIGMLVVDGDDTHVHRISIEPVRCKSHRAGAPAVRVAAEQLEAWFDGALTAFDLALAPPRTMRGSYLRAGLIAVGYGETRSYGELAHVLGSGARAIGQHCARNAFPIVVPCHRIVGAGGSLGHYSAGDGTSTKRWLLDHEAAHRL